MSRGFSFTLPSTITKKRRRDFSETNDPRNKRPKPDDMTTTRKEGFTMPDPFNEPSVPTLTTENPHRWLSQRGSPPDYIPKDTAIPFTDAVFPKAVLPYHELIKNLAELQVESIENTPDSFLAIVPFGAGTSFNEDNPRAHIIIQEFLRSLEHVPPRATPAPAEDLDSMEDGEIPERAAGPPVNAATTVAHPRITVIRPVAKTGKSTNDKDGFRAPFTFILEGGSKLLRDFLVYYQTFAINERLAFTIVPFDHDIQSWVIMNITGDEETLENEGQILGSIKKTLWASPLFRPFVDRVLAAAQVEGSTDERVVTATQSWTLQRVRVQSKDGSDFTILQLQGKPISADWAVHRAWLDIIRKTKYWVGMNLLTINGKFVECCWCRAQTHPAFACPLPQIEGWQGPCPDNRARFQASLASNGNGNANGNNRGTGGNRNRRGGGNIGTRGGRDATRGRGRAVQKSREDGLGWTEVSGKRRR